MAPVLFVLTSLRLSGSTKDAFPDTVTGIFPKNDQIMSVKIEKNEIPTNTLTLG